MRRTSPSDWGNSASSWEADGPTPGTVEQRLPTLVAVDVNPIDHHLIRSDWLPVPQDPPDRPSGPQPSSWSIQRSSLSTVVLTFSEPVSFDLDALTLTNLGVDSPNEADRTIDLSTATLVSVGRTVTLQLDPNALSDGVYQLDVGEGINDLQDNPLDGDADGRPGGRRFPNPRQHGQRFLPN